MDLETFAPTRGFTVEELSKWDITVDERGRVIIPTKGRQRSWGNRIHLPKGKPKYRAEVKGQGNHLYNPLGLGPNSEQIWLTEGEFDTLSLVTIGAPAVGVLGAAGFREEWALLFAGARVFVAFDPNSESEKQAKRVGAIMSLLPHAVRFDPLVVGGYNDINDWFKADRLGLKEKVAQWMDHAY